jgi:DnaK suppressor protein
MPVKKPSAPPAKGTKTVSAKAAKPAPKAAAKEKAAPRKVAPVAKPAAGPAAVTKPAVATKPATSSRPATAAPEKIVVRVQPEPVTDASRAEEPDFEMSPSLLSGPRNVQPYQIRKGEEYMSKEQLDHFRLILSSWKRDLMQEVDRTVLHMKDEAANFPDPNDRATQESEFSLELRTRDRERKLIRKIDEALKRIDDGSYGFCLETGEPIGVKRLEARPVATLSVEAQERRERREKQFGDRDDFYR